MVITLISDLGYKDSSLGMVKGVLTHALPQANIIDITHDIIPFHILECSYVLKKTFRFFPDQTIHVCLFDIPLKEVTHWLLLEVEGQLILCSDNGVLPLTFPEYLDAIRSIPLHAESFTDCVQQISYMIAEWMNEGLDMSEYEKIQPRITMPTLSPLISEDGIEAQVLHIDNYGNVVYNLQKNDFYKVFNHRKFEILYSRHEKATKIVTFYEDVPEGETLFRFNDSGFLEFAVNKGSANKLYGISNTPARQLVYSKISIRFIND